VKVRRPKTAVKTAMVLRLEILRWLTQEGGGKEGSISFLLGVVKSIHKKEGPGMFFVAAKVERVR